MRLEFEEIKMENIDKKLKVLDDFNNYYGWSIFTKSNYFILHDDQTGDIEFFDWKYKLIDRICGRALDYIVEETEWDDNKIGKDDYQHIIELLFIYNAFVGLNMEMNKKWYETKIKWLLGMELI